MNRDEPFDRHVLAVTLWLGLGAVAAVLLRLGWNGKPLYLLAGVGALLAAFAGHVVVNALSGTRFSAGELALGLVVYAASLAGFSLAVLVSPAARANAVPVFAGFAVLFVAVVGYMLTAYGPRGAFDAFDRIRSFRLVRGADAQDRS